MLGMMQQSQRERQAVREGLFAQMEGERLGDWSEVEAWERWEAGGGGQARPDPAARLVDAGVFGVDGGMRDGYSSLSTRDEPAEVLSGAEVRAAVMAEAQRVAEAFVGQAPMGNTGHKFTFSYLVHCAEGTVFNCQLSEFLNLLCCCLYDDFDPFTEDPFTRFEEVGPSRMFKRFLKGPGGVVVKAEPTMAVGRDYLCWELPGEWFELNGLERFARLLGMIHETGCQWHLTRLDDAFDGVGFAPEQMYKLLEAGQVRSLAQRSTLKFERKPFGSRDGKDEAGDTCNWGRRGSGDFLRCYNKRGFTRLEHECRRDRAKIIGWQMVNTPVERWHVLALGHVRDFLDLVVRPDGVNVSRCTELQPCWAEFVGQVERFKMNVADTLKKMRQRVRVTVASIDRCFRQIERRVALLVKSLPKKVVEERFKRADLKLGPKLLVRAAEWGQVLKVGCEVFGDDEVWRHLMTGGAPPGSGGGAWAT